MRTPQLIISQVLNAMIIILLLICFLDITYASTNSFAFNHEMNSFVLGISLGLMILICFFSFIFQTFNFHYLPEPSVCLILGMIVGIALKYGNRDKSENPPINYIPLTNTLKTIPEYISIKNDSSTYYYKMVSLQDQEISESSIISSKVMFDPEIFFYLILPPIIFNCGLKMKKKFFFRNIGSILALALLGTTITLLTFSIIVRIYAFFSKSISDMGLDFVHSLLFGIIISSTDPVSVLAVFTRLGVDIDLYSIILGESALNDAVSVTSQRTVNDYMEKFYKSKMPYTFMNFLKSVSLFFGILFGSFALGSIAALLNSLFTKTFSFKRYPIMEVSLFFIFSYASFLISEMFSMVGIVAVLFCGIFQQHYTFQNMSVESKILISRIFELICFFLENFVFCYMGITVFAFSHHIWNVGFIIWSMIALIIARATSVYLICYVLNFKRHRKIPLNYQHLMFFAGLKGAISFALVLEDTSTPLRKLLFTSTVMLVLITVLIFGGSIYKLIYWLNIPFSHSNPLDNCSDPSEEVNEIEHDFNDESMIMKLYRNLDDKF